MPSTTALPQGATSTRSTPIPSWRTVVWDDPVNLMDYVTGVFIRHFGYSASKARALMMEVHTRGRAVVSTGMRERMEADVVAMHGYGLKATLEAVS
ncbi:ATP-dependent Clp protease adapter ClpS [Schaalia sp.]|uniref:ATP-dependent Clp protease adapter ClpS n=1 Tax=Schaalia sp. TaxID=2691890 RepID=UPI003D0D8D56